MASILVPGRDLGGYRLEARLGRGGMGEVWSAHDVVLGRRVAIKVMLGAEGEDVRLRERFVREGRAAAALVHPSVVTVFATGETDGVAWLAMELVEGQTLRAVGRSAPLATKVAWLSALASGLDAVHRAGFVHRDVKPDNVMIARDGHLKLLDFGLVRPPPGAAPLTRTGYVMGTPRYMAPEQWRGETVDARADQFAWGLVAFELLSGRHPDDCSAGFGRLASWAAPARPIASLVPEVRPEIASGRCTRSRRCSRG